MKKLVSLAVTAVFALGLVALLTSTPADAAKGNCSTVRCMACPDGYRVSLKWPNCCQCIPIN